jgi:hypothetical protein
VHCKQTGQHGGGQQKVERLLPRMHGGIEDGRFSNLDLYARIGKQEKDFCLQFADPDMVCSSDVELRSTLDPDEVLSVV